MHTKKIMIAGLILGTFLTTPAYAEQPGEGASAHKAPHHSLKHRKSGGPMMKADTNGDGVISASELSAMQAEHFSRTDINGDGQITIDEITEARERRRREHERRKSERHVKKLDKNGDGVVSREEFYARHHEHFNKMDANKDGQLSQEERRTAHRAMMKERREKRIERRRSHSSE